MGNDDYLVKYKDKSNDNELFIENIDDFVIPKQPIFIKKSKKIYITIWVFSSIIITLSIVLFIYSFNNISFRKDNLSQGDILTMTSYSKEDSLLIRQLKDKALSDWIATRNTTKLIELNENTKMVTEIMKGELPESKLAYALDNLSKNVNANTEQIQQLKVQYEVSLLQKNINKLTEVFNNSKVVEWGSMKSVMSQSDKVVNSLKSASEVWLQSENSDYGLLQEINDGITKLEGVQSQVSVVKKYSELLAKPTQISDIQLVGLEFSAPMSSQLSSQYNQLADFVSQNNQIIEQKEIIEQLKQKLSGTVDVPNFVGVTLKEAKKNLAEFNKKNKSNLTFSGVDGIDDGKIIESQTPSFSEFDKMKNNGIITLVFPATTTKSTSKEDLTSTSSSEIKISKSSSENSSESTKIIENSSEEESQHVDGNQDTTTVHVDD